MCSLYPQVFPVSIGYFLRLGNDTPQSVTEPVLDENLTCDEDEDSVTERE